MGGYFVDGSSSRERQWHNNLAGRKRHPFVSAVFAMGDYEPAACGRYD
jgi:hypothetical protein